MIISNENCFIKKKLKKEKQEMGTKIPIIRAIICVAFLGTITEAAIKLNNNKSSCCPNGSVMRKICIADGTGIVQCSKLMCSNKNNVDSLDFLKCENGRYILDPSDSEMDQFEVNDDGWLKFIANDHRIPPGEFCTSEMVVQNHLNVTTTPIALICFEPAEQSYYSMFIFKGCLALISVVFLIVTLYVYWLIPELRETQVRW